jgi:tripartite-type tricarboxylate transporter receptor subunit TctC
VSGIGVGRVARATPDGYTFLIGQWGTNVASGAIYPLQFDLMKDLEPVALIATQPFLIVAGKTMPANTLPERSHGSKQGFEGYTPAARDDNPATDFGEFATWIYCSTVICFW